MLKKIKIFFLALIAGLICVGIAKDKIFDTPVNAFKKISHMNGRDDVNVFGTSKVLTYKMFYWSIIPMGELKFVTNASDQKVVFSAEARSQGSFIGNFISASARVESHFSKQDLLPFKYAEITDVNGKVKSREVFYDRTESLAVQGNKKIRIPKETYDPLGAFIRALSYALEVEQNVSTLFISSGDLYNLRARLLEQKGNINEVAIDIKRQNLSSSHGGSLHLWMASDTRIPLVFKSWTPVGYASVVLDKLEVQ
ncbi:MAG TPA: hypothetical protein DCL35_02440 [Candidatus Omnitrophica bacterium]|nr:hypothetical protein [Candidatus Omnitrophota bacterium]